jgi:siroheme synthase-like protein
MGILSYYCPMSYPVLLRLEGRRCLVVGGGKVATHKVDGLLAASAQVMIISPTLHPTLTGYFQAEQIKWLSQPYSPDVYSQFQPFIVFAATNLPEVNQQVADGAKHRGILVNIVDSSTESDFSNMIAIRQPPITIGLATGGTSPALSKHLQLRLRYAIGAEYSVLAQWLGELRPVIKAKIESESKRKQFWDEVIASDTLSLLRDGDDETARALVQSLYRQFTGDSRWQLQR